MHFEQRIVALDLLLSERAGKERQGLPSGKENQEGA